MKTTKYTSLAGFVVLGGVLMSPAMVHAGSHTWVFNEAFTNASGTIQFIELRESMGGNTEQFVNGHVIASATAPAHTFTIPGNPLPPNTGFKTLLFATPAAAAVPGFPTPDYILNAAPFFSVNADTLSCTGWPNFSWPAGGMPTDGVHSRNIGGVIACSSPKNYSGVTATLNLGCTMPGDVDGDGAVNGGDIAGYIRAVLNASIAGDHPACAEYCQGSVSANTAAFVNNLLTTN